MCAYRFFQFEFVPPDDDSSAIVSRSAAAPSNSDNDATSIDPELLNALPPGAYTSEPDSSVMHVVVRTSPMTQRTWVIQKCIISRHSSYLRAACENASATSIDLTGDSMSLAAFQNFVDFSHSNIYSVNRIAPDYHVIYTHLQAWVLGVTLGAPVYQTTALRELYTNIEPLARAVNSSVEQSPIHVKDVDFVCRKTQEGCVLRALIFDAVAAHWTQRDVITMGANLVRESARAQGPEPHPQPVEALTWPGLYNKYPDFRRRMSSSLKVHDGQRARLLRPLNDYIAGKTGMQEAEFVNEEIARSFFGARPRALLERGHMRSPSRRRRSSSTSSEGLQGGRLGEKHVGEDEFMTIDDA